MAIGLSASLCCASLAGWPLHSAGAQPVPPAATAPQPVELAPGRDLLSQPQLEQLLAPVALYPDALLMQLLMASTYPLEVVQAQRWLGQGRNGALRGDALAQALQSQGWDASVKSLVPFPDVLKMMNDQLEWTQQVGDAVLAQQADVMNAVQVLRGRARAAGQLESGPQQTVTVTQNVTVPPAAGAAASAVVPPPQVITIAPTQPEQVYVPAYNPAVVYGTWPYPSYPPAYYPPPVGWGVGSAILTGMAFAGGVAAVSSLWGWARPGWGGGNVDIDVNRVNNINANRGRISGNTWSHDSAHRHGVAYRNQEVGNRYRGGGGAAGAGAAATRDRAQSRDEFRGRMEQAERGGGIGDQRPGGGDRPGVGQGRPGGGDRLGAGEARPGGGDRPGIGQGRPGGDRPGGGQARPGGGRPGAGEARPGGGQAQRPAQRPAASPSGRPQFAEARPQARQAPQAMQGIGQGDQVRGAQRRGEASRQARPQAASRQARPQAAQSARGGGAAAHRGGGGRGGRR